MKTRYLRFLLSFVLAGFYAFSGNATPSVFSNYGQIQNVQNYSSNPFWTPSSPYNQRLPQPVYVQGADLNAEDCFRVVQSLVSVQCMARDNCKNTSLSDVRPAIMVQLSNLPGANYVSACSGYIDGVYASYVAQFSNDVPNRPVAFPTGTVPNPDLNNNSAPVIKNPYEIKTPQWQQEINERTQELKQLQEQNGAGREKLSATGFPDTYADLTFSERMANATAGYEPFADKSAYVLPEFQKTEDYCPTHLEDPACAEYKKKVEALAKLSNSSNGYADLTQDELDIVEEIVKWFNPQSSAERSFLTDLVSSFIKSQETNSDLILDEQFVYDFLSENNNFDKYKSGLLDLSGVMEDEDYMVSIDWDEVLIQLSMILDAAERRRGALVCENNRSYEAGIDTAMWVGTAVAAIFSFGTAGAAAAGGRVLLGNGLKALAKGSTKIGLKSLGKTLTKASRKQLVKSGVKLSKGLKVTEKVAAKWTNKKITKEVSKRAGKQVWKNLHDKKNLLIASGAVAGVIYETLGDDIARATGTTQTSTGQRVAGTLLSLVDSDPSIDFINCQDLDHKSGCYAVCGHDDTNDMLNTKVFQPLLGRTYCVDEKDYTLYDTQTHRPLYMNAEEYTRVTQKIRTDVADKGGCDWNEDDIDMYLGSYIYNPDTLEPSPSLIIEEFIRLDD